MKTHEHSITRIVGLSTELDSLYNSITKLKIEVEALKKKLKGR